MKLLLIGAPASGKGTLGGFLAGKLNVPIVSVGGLLRAIPETDKNYQEIHKYMDIGHLVPSEITSAILREELSKEAYSMGYILDGWMRGLDEKNYFDPEVDFAVFINVSDETSMERARGRNTGREDDNEEVVKRRLGIFHNETQPVLEFYRSAGKLIEVDGEPPREQVLELTLAALKEKGVL